MNYQSQEKLMRYQSDYQAVNEQSILLRNQVEPLQAQISAMQQYLGSNPGDRKVKAEYNKLVQRYNQLGNQLRRNDMRMATLTRQITIEQQKICQQQQRAMMSAQKKMMRRGYY